jgi:hypothetical protein
MLGFTYLDEYPGELLMIQPVVTVVPDPVPGPIDEVKSGRRKRPTFNDLKDVFFKTIGDTIGTYFEEPSSKM